MTAQASVRRRPQVGVFGSGSEGHADLSAPLGRALADRDVHLVIGGGGGVMADVARAFVARLDRRGLVISVLPARDLDRPSETPAGYPNPYVELAIRTHLPRRAADAEGRLGRNPIVALTSDVAIALPGDVGTRQEIAFATRAGRPVALLGRGDPIDGARRCSDLSDALAWLDDQLRALRL